MAERRQHCKKQLFNIRGELTRRKKLVYYGAKNAKRGSRFRRQEPSEKKKPGDDVS